MNFHQPGYRLFRARSDTTAVTDEPQDTVDSSRQLLLVLKGSQISSNAMVCKCELTDHENFPAGVGFPHDVPVGSPLCPSRWASHVTRLLHAHTHTAQVKENIHREYCECCECNMKLTNTAVEYMLCTHKHQYECYLTHQIVRVIPRFGEGINWDGRQPNITVK